MITSSHVRKREKDWVVKVIRGKTSVVYGPYRWEWLARFVGWLESGKD